MAALERSGRHRHGHGVHVLELGDADRADRTEGVLSDRAGFPRGADYNLADAPAKVTRAPTADAVGPRDHGLTQIAANRAESP
jgi:hypothetical protein